MRVSRIILLLVALIAGGLAAFLATRPTTPEQIVVEGPAQVIEEKKTQILVASAPIGVGQRLSEETVQWQDWPELAVRAEYVNKQTLPDAIEELTDAVARFEFFPGEPIIEQKLVRSATGYMSAVLAKGMRGVSVMVSPQAASGGFIFPNDRVDVVVTRAGTSGVVSETILQNVKVLSINRRLGETGTTGTSADPENPGADVFQEQAIATLELTPGQGEQIINASQAGSLSLVLRSMADFEMAEGAPLTPEMPNRNIRLIRAGQDRDVTANTIAGGPEVSPATYNDEAGATEGQVN